MDELIAALTLAKKYVESDSYQAKYPTHCEHDVLMLNIDYREVSAEDLERFAELSFVVDEYEYDSLVSYKFGSC